MLCKINSLVLLLLLLAGIVSCEVDYGRASPFVIVQQGPFNISPEQHVRRSVYATNLSPDSLKTLYGMSVAPDAGAGKTIAVIDAFAHSSAEDDLTVFSNYYGLPLCTSSNGCFKRVNQNGGTTFTTGTSAAWAQETSLDLQWAHAVAPGANILYVEANSDSLNDLMMAVSYASKNADYVSMSFGVPESAIHAQLESYFVSSTTSFFAAAGDVGGKVNYPAASPLVIGVGGTTLYTSPSGTLMAEDGWSDSGGGCSQYFTAASDQLTYSSSTCGTKRAVPDVSFNANPSSGVLVYVSEGCAAPPACWFTLGGTSLSSPIMAARSAVQATVVKSSFVYNSNNILFRDITKGDNGNPCGEGYDLVTGQGSWVNNASVITPVVTAATPIPVPTPTYSPTKHEIPTESTTTTTTTTITTTTALPSAQASTVQQPPIAQDTYSTTGNYFSQLGSVANGGSCNQVSTSVVAMLGAICLCVLLI